MKFNLYIQYQISKKQHYLVSGNSNAMVQMNYDQQPLAFVKKHGVVLVSAKGPVPRFTEAIANGPVKGNWWAHPKSRQIFEALQSVVESGEVLVCRLVNGKRTLVHRQLWPALARTAKMFQAENISRIIDVHTPSGHHEITEVAFPDWVPAEVMRQSKTMKEKDALVALGPWAVTLNK